MHNAIIIILLRLSLNIIAQTLFEFSHGIATTLSCVMLRHEENKVVRAEHLHEQGKFVFDNVSKSSQVFLISRKVKFQDPHKAYKSHNYLLPFHCQQQQKTTLFPTAT